MNLIEKHKGNFDIITELLESLGEPYRSITNKKEKFFLENSQIKQNVSAEAQSCWIYFFL